MQVLVCWCTPVLGSALKAPYTQVYIYIYIYIYYIYIYIYNYKYNYTYIYIVYIYMGGIGRLLVLYMSKQLPPE